MNEETVQIKDLQSLGRYIMNNAKLLEGDLTFGEREAILNQLMAFSREAAEKTAVLMGSN